MSFYPPMKRRAGIAFAISMILFVTMCANTSLTFATTHATCNSIIACQRLSEQTFHSTFLLPHNAIFLGGARSSEGLGLDFRLKHGPDFRTIVNRAKLNCHDAKHNAETSSFGRSFCYQPFENGASAFFFSGGLTYLIILTQDDIFNKQVPRLPQVLTAVSSYGAP